MLRIKYFTNSADSKISRAYFQNFLKGVDLVLGKKKGDLGIHLVTEEEMRALNKRYRGKDTVTDVLSFAYHESREMPHEDLFGEIFLSTAQIKRQAPKSHNTFEEELQFIFVHGVLHLLGYDHQTTQDESAMHRLTYKILQSKHS